MNLYFASAGIYHGLILLAALCLILRKIKTAPVEDSNMVMKDDN